MIGMHLDGARLFNAVVTTGRSAREITAAFDSVSICLSKGLGAPMGSVLCASNELVRKARRWRKMLGGAMRQAGMMAAAGQYALQHNIERLAEDHDNARSLHVGLSAIPALSVQAEVDTNMVYLTLPKSGYDQLLAAAQEHNIVLPAGRSMRLVTHLDVNAAGVERVLDLFRSHYAS